MGNKKMETEFTALVFNNNWVDGSMLHKGLYSYYKPIIFPKDQTIQDLVDNAIKLNEGKLEPIFTNEYLKNLTKCKLIKVSFKFK